MKSLSISFTLGKASSGNANVAHNNREIIANNVDPNRICLNVDYVNRNVEEVYSELFSESLAEYNAKQKQPCRRIHDYYNHIADGHREEPFYEVVVQFGCMKTSPVGSAEGEVVKQLLDEYMKSFQERNPNLKVFAAHLHMDESAPHLHIDFVPFYTKGRQKGLSKGVSMKSALDEMGFTAKNYKQNRLVAWQDSERKFMESILNRHGLEREVKNDNSEHQSVPEYKTEQDEIKLREMYGGNLLPSEITAETIERLQLENGLLQIENSKLQNQQLSPWKSFYYSDSAKQEHVIAELERLHIPYRNTENGFESQECFVNEIRKIEKIYKPKSVTYKEQLRDILDLVIMQSKSYDEVLEKLQGRGCEIKQGKYLSVRPQYATNFIRTKSLGAEYSEQGIRNRLTRKHQFEQANEVQINSTKSDSLEHMTFKTIRHYTVVFASGNYLPMKRKNKKMPFAWTNDEQLDKLAELNRKINAGANLTSLQNDFKSAEETVAREVSLLERIKSDTTLPGRIYTAGFNFFGYGNAPESEKMLLRNFNVTADNYKDGEKIIAGYLERIERSLSENREKLRECSEMLTLAEKVAGATLVQDLVDEQKHRSQSDIVPNGIKSANNLEQNAKIEEVVRSVVMGKKH
jgi:hypothetical protein